ncbi:MAG TPA: hypothetical protein VHO28_13850 [Ignavibacteriales bacterium]|nr:hypothetical protein [Ignavibacteriales bacterium]
MKKLIVSLTALILIAFIFVSCSDKIQEDTNPAVSGSPKGTYSPATICGDQWFPTYSTTIGVRCLCGSNVGAQYSNQLIADMWSHYVAAYNDNFEDACLFEGEDDPGVKAPASISALQSGNYPKVQWQFVYSHFYIIERKVGTGAWTTLATIGNRGVDNPYDYYTLGGTPYYVDNTINLNAAHPAIYYRVRTRNFAAYSSSYSPEAYYAASVLAASITGPTDFYHPNVKGITYTYTWTAGASGGTPPYTYSWSSTLGTSSASTFTYISGYRPPSTSVVTRTIALTVTDSQGGAASTVKTVYEHYGIEP